MPLESRNESKNDVITKFRGYVFPCTPSPQPTSCGTQKLLTKAPARRAKAKTQAKRAAQLL
jgi:hypothetical protein